MTNRLCSDETRLQIETIKAIFDGNDDWETARKQLTCGTITHESAIVFTIERLFVLHQWAKERMKNENPLAK